ncbi:MAG: hypothetical protein R2716_10205 [Microthrixaceae bacterium]
MCSKPLESPSAVPALRRVRAAAGAMAARVGPNEAGFPVAAVWLLVVGVLLASAVVLSSIHWG